MIKKFMLLLVMVTSALLVLVGCSMLTGEDGADGLNGTNGVDGTDTGILGASVYLDDDGTTSKYYTGDLVYLSYSLYGGNPSAVSTMNLHLINESWTSLTLSGVPLIEDLGGWNIVSGVGAYVEVPTITATAPTVSVVDFETPVGFSLTFAPVALPENSRFRKRYRIALQDAEGTHYSFDFEVEATITC